MRQGLRPMIRLAVAILAMSLAGPAHAQAKLTDANCKAVAIAMGQVFEALPRETLSQPFRQSATGFVKATNACAGPYPVEIASDADAKALADVIAMLSARSPAIDLGPLIEIVDRRSP